MLCSFWRRIVKYFFWSFEFFARIFFYIFEGLVKYFSRFWIFLQDFFYILKESWNIFWDFEFFARFFFILQYNTGWYTSKYCNRKGIRHQYNHRGFFPDSSSTAAAVHGASGFPPEIIFFFRLACMTQKKSKKKQCPCSERIEYCCSKV